MKEKKSPKFYTIFWGCFSIFMIVLDFLSKWTVQNLLEEGEQVVIIKDFCYVTLAHNLGIAFSIGTGTAFERIINAIISLIVSICIALYYFSNKEKHSSFMKAVLSLLFAGAVGNFIDRAFYWKGIVGFDGVIDFIQFYLGGGPGKAHTIVNPFATFNVADSCLTIGVILFMGYLAVDYIKNGKEEDLSKDPREEKNKESQETENK